MLARSTVSVPSFAERDDKGRGMIGAIYVCMVYDRYAVDICMNYDRCTVDICMIFLICCAVALSIRSA